MGCDIHCYIEFQTPGTDHWVSFGENINPGRHYVLFGRLAGVRGGPGPMTVAPRGIPVDLGVNASTAYWWWIERDGTPHAREVSAATAERHVRSGDARCREPSRFDSPAGLPHWISNPDAHTPTWLTPDEFAAALADEYDPTYGAMLAAMRSLESRGLAVRVVMWFDN